jgi:hypothetical protein
LRTREDVLEANTSASRNERSLEAAVVKRNDNAFGAGSAVLALADVLAGRERDGARRATCLATQSEAWRSLLGRRVVARTQIDEPT